MSKLRFRTYYDRKLPHFQPPGATLFVTFRLAGSLPAYVIQNLRDEFSSFQTNLESSHDPDKFEKKIYAEQRRYFGKWDKALDTSTTGPFWLRNEKIASVVSESLHFLNNQRYELDAFSIMPNHVHAVFKPLPIESDEYYSLSGIMHSLKRHTALEANKILNRKGQFWQHECYDHVVRDEAEHHRIIQYVINNPVAAGLVAEWRDWPWTYCRFEP